MKITSSRTLSLLTLAFLACPAALAATEAAKPDFAESVQKTTTQLDEVIVSGKLDQLSALRKAVNDAEDRFLHRYNELNDNWLYDVVCTTYQPIGTRVPMRLCEANFIADAKRMAVLYGLQQNGDVSQWNNKAAVVYPTAQDELQKHMKALVESDAELQRALVERSLLIERYEKVRKQKFAGRKVVWD